MVTSVPLRLTSATPIGIKYSLSGTSPFIPYICSLSIKITGSLSRMALFKRPITSAGLDGTITLRPGVFAYQWAGAGRGGAPGGPAGPGGPRGAGGAGY